MNIVVGDVAGQLEALLKIYLRAKEKYPNIKLWGVGDLNDRGPLSAGVIEFMMNNAEGCTDSNHGQMFMAFLNPELGTAYASDKTFCIASILVRLQSG